MLGEEAARPADVAAVRPGGDELEIDAVARAPTAMKRRNSVRVLFRREAAPQPHDSLPMPQNSTLNGSRSPAAARTSERVVSPAGRVAVFDPFVEVLRRQAAHISGEVGLRARELAEPHELVGAEPVRLILLRAGVEFAYAWLADCRDVGPEVGPARALLAWTDAVAPVVAVGETAARPAHDARLDPRACARRAPCECRRCSGPWNSRPPRCRRRRRRPGARRSGRKCRARSCRWGSSVEDGRCGVVGRARRCAGPSEHRAGGPGLPARTCAA